jgi:hypothetical protein
MFIEAIVEEAILDRIKQIENDNSCGFEIDWIENTPEGLEKHGIDGDFLGPDSETPGVNLFYVRLWVNAPLSPQILSILEKDFNL